MAAKKSTPSTPETISDILQVTTGEFSVCLLGTSPLFFNCMSDRAQRELLMPRGRKNAVEKATSLKHDPIDEFRTSAEQTTEGPTLIVLSSAAFKGALRTAALDMPGAKKAQIGRLTYVTGDVTSIYGVPKLDMRGVRSADMNKTPDIRTRAIMPEWACELTITFVRPLIQAQAVANLLAAAGITIGVGDGRPEKGALSFGQFRLTDRNDPDVQRIMKTGAREAQVEAMAHPVCYNEKSTELLAWYQAERGRRQLKGVA